ncbi:MAG: hypothetical protein HWN66_06265 [Candidatus Helarchaeota archaeon]|nr:hypothetical protein [Candidatus Helarchaeota archaeon]
MTTPQVTNRLADETIPQFQPELMVKLLATIDNIQHPNLVLIVSLEAKDNVTLMFAEFLKGKTKKNVELNPKCTAAFMNLGFDYWVVKGDFTHWGYEGAEYEYFNEKSLFKNNAYLGITRVGFIDIKQVFPKRKIKMKRPLLRLIKGFIKEGNSKTENPEILPSIVEKIFRAPSNLKYITFIDDDGYPLIVPTMHLLPANANQLIFTPAGFKEDLTRMKSGMFVATFAMNIEELIMYQIKGTYQGMQKYQETELGVINIEEVYCCMPPKAGDRII